MDCKLVLACILNILNCIHICDTLGIPFHSRLSDQHIQVINLNKFNNSAVELFSHSLSLVLTMDNTLVIWLNNSTAELLIVTKSILMPMV